MKMKLRYLFGLGILMLLLLIYTCPTDEDYREWLENKHGIACWNDGINSGCKKSQNGIEEPVYKVSSHTQHGMIYKKIRDRYRDEKGNIMEFHSFGMLKVIVDL